MRVGVTVYSNPGLAQSPRIRNIAHSSFLFQIYKSPKMGKTYGEKPIVFKFEENGEEYMIGSEVGNYLRLFRGALYKKYPGLMRRTLSNEERKRMIEMGHSQHVTSSTISLLLTKESSSCNIQSRFLFVCYGDCCRGGYLYFLLFVSTSRS